MMAATVEPLEVASLPAEEEQILKEKNPVVVDVLPALSSKASSDHSPSTSSIEPSSGSKFELEDHPIDEGRKLRGLLSYNLTTSLADDVQVAVIGAGISGVTAGVLLPVKVPGIQLQIFDKNADVGGTWFENIYVSRVLRFLPSYYDSFHKKRGEGLSMIISRRHTCHC